MLVYDFLKENRPVNVQFDIEKGIVRFVPPVEGSRWCMRKREDFSELYGEIVSEYMDHHDIDTVYAALFFDRSDADFEDIIRLYATWPECDKELKGHSNMYRKCVRGETLQFVLNFMAKDFSADRMERSWYFADKKYGEKRDALINAQKRLLQQPQANGVQMSLDDYGTLTQDISGHEAPEHGVPAGGSMGQPIDKPACGPAEKPKKKTKKELILEEENRKCRENGLDPSNKLPWESVDEYIGRKGQKAGSGEYVTVHMTLRKEDFDRILASYEVKVIGGIKGEPEKSIVYSPEGMESFFDELEGKKKPKKKRGRPKKKPAI